VRVEQWVARAGEQEARDKEKESEERAGSKKSTEQREQSITGRIAGKAG
jgi:hypothetical protein